MIILYVAMALLSTSCLVALAYYILLAYLGDSKILYTLYDQIKMTWKHKIFFGLAAIGLLVCFFQGAEAMLFWIPKSWGFVDSDDSWMSYSTSFALGFAAMSTAFIGFLESASSHDIIHARLDEENDGLRQIIDSAYSLDRLTITKNSFDRKIEKLKEELSPGRDSITARHKIAVYQALAHTVGEMQKKPHK